MVFLRNVVLFLQFGDLTINLPGRPQMQFGPQIISVNPWYCVYLPRSSRKTEPTVSRSAKNAGDTEEGNDGESANRKPVGNPGLQQEEDISNPEPEKQRGRCCHLCLQAAG